MKDKNEFLRNISEELKILSDEEKKILSKEFLTEEDQENLKTIEELSKELIDELNVWASESQQKNKVVESTKTLEEQYKEITAKVDAIENESKDKQNKLVSTDKMHKKEILARNGFTKTLTADERPRMIHNSLVGKYYDLIKEQRILQQQLKEKHQQQIEEEKRKRKIKSDQEISSKRNAFASESQQKPEVIESSQIFQQQLQQNSSQEYGQQMKQEGSRENEITPKVPAEDSSIHQDSVVKSNNVTMTQVDQIQELENKIKEILMEKGKKDRIKYKGSRYLVPTNRKGYFTTIMSELDKLKSQLEEVDPKAQSTSLLSQNTMEGLDANIPNQGAIEEEKQRIQDQVVNNSTLTQEELGKQIRKLEEVEEISSPRKLGPTVSSDNNISQSSDIDQFIKWLSNERDALLNKNGRKTIVKYKNKKYKVPIDRIQNFLNIMDSLDKAKQKKAAESDKNLDSSQIIDQSTVIKELKNSGKKSESGVRGRIVRTRKPKKNISKKMLAGITGIAAALVIIASGAKNIYNKFIKNLPNQTVSEIPLDQNNHINNLSSVDTNLTKLITEYESDDQAKNMEPSTEEHTETISKQNISPTNIEYAPEETDSTNIKLGSFITVTGELSNDEYSAYSRTNQHLSYFGLDTKRVVIGVGIVNENGMNTVYAYEPNANQIIDNLLNEGGELVSILTTTKEQYLQDYDGSRTLTKEEVQASAEGWYNINDVEINKVKGVSR